MFRISLLRNPAIPVMASLVLSACGAATVDPEAHLVPDEPGIYAAQNGKLQRLDGTREWETKTWGRRSNLSKDVQIVVYDPKLKPLDQNTIAIYEVGWVRSEISSDGDINPIIKGSRWAVPRTQRFRVPATLDRVAGRSDVIRAIPEEPLKDGLYSIQVRSGSKIDNARIGVNWPNLDHDAYATRHCVDRYQETSGSRLQACDQQHQLLLSKNLRVHLVKPSREMVDGREALVVRGVLANNGKRRRETPPLTAELRDGEGRVLKRWQFVPQSDALEPGQSVPFETRVVAPPSGTETVNVKFGSTLTARQ